MMSLDLIERLTLVLGIISGVVSVAVWLVRVKLRIEKLLDDVHADLVEIKRDVKRLL